MILPSEDKKPTPDTSNVLKAIADAVAEAQRLANQTDDREPAIVAMQIADAGRRLRRWQREGGGA